MKKIALALLLIFAAFTWACDDGIDERASFSSAYVAASADSYDVAVDLFSKQDVGGTCTPVPFTEALSKNIIFSVWVKPNQNGALSQIAIKSVEVRYTLDDGGGSGLSSLKNDWVMPIFDSSADISTLTSYTYTVSLPLITPSAVQQTHVDYDTTRSLITYTADYKLTLFEYGTGIEDEIYVKGIRVSFNDTPSTSDCQ